jgi:hypothetical protein
MVGPNRSELNSPTRKLATISTSELVPMIRMCPILPTDRAGVARHQAHSTIGLKFSGELETE